VGNLIIRLVILQSDWYSGIRDSNVAPHCSFLHSLSLWVTELCRRVTSAFREGSLVTCHRVRSRFFQAYFMLNACWYRGSFVVTWATLGSGSS
jgi:uncharacterized membrane protein